MGIQRRVYRGATHEFFGASAVSVAVRDAISYGAQRIRLSF